MKQGKIWREFSALSPELQQQVIDFIAFLRVRYAMPSGSKTTRRTKSVKRAVYRHVARAPRPARQHGMGSRYPSKRVDARQWLKWC